MAQVTPVSPVSTKITGTVAVPVAAQAARASPSPTKVDWVTSSSRRRSRRSASPPAHAPRTRAGPTVSAVSTARSTALWVSRRISQEDATAWVMVPDADSTWALNHHRKRASVSEASAGTRLSTVSRRTSVMRTPREQAGSVRGGPRRPGRPGTRYPS